MLRDAYVLAWPSSDEPPSADGNKYRDLQVDKMWKVRNLFCPKRDVPNKSLLLGLRELYRSGQMLAANVDERHGENKAF